MNEFFFFFYLILGIIASVWALLKFNAKEIGVGVVLTIVAILLLAATFVTCANPA